MVIKTKNAILTKIDCPNCSLDEKPKLYQSVPIGIISSAEHICFECKARFLSKKNGMEFQAFATDTFIQRHNI